MSTTPASAVTGLGGRSLLSAVGRRMTGVTTIYMIATATTLPIALISAIITVHFLKPAEFGDLGLLMVMASFLTVIYNMGILHGTFLWVYGSSGDADVGDLEVEGKGQRLVRGQQRGMTTGLLLTIIIVSAGTILCFQFAAPLAQLILGHKSRADLIALAGFSGGTGALYRMTTNIFRFERRITAYSIATVARPVGVLVGSTALIVAGYGIWGAIVGTAVPTLIIAIGSLIAARNSYALQVSRHDLVEILKRSAIVVIPVSALWVAHNGDIYLLAPFAHATTIGVYRLASRLGSPPSYFAGAVMMSWSPLERSPVFLAAFKDRGHQVVRSYMVTYYVIVSLAIVVIFALFSRVLLLMAPSSYGSAAKIVPLIALAFVLYGMYIVVLRTVRPEPLTVWYGATATLSAVVFAGSAQLLIPAFGLYGAPVALTLGMASGVSALLLLNTRKTQPLPIQWRRILAALAVTVGVSAAGMAAAAGGRPSGIPVALLLLVAYPVLLVLGGAVPRAHLPVLWSMIRRSEGEKYQLALDDLPTGERAALQAMRDDRLAEHDVVGATRVVRGLRRLGGVGTPSLQDVRIGSYLCSREPESIRDLELKDMVDEGIDPLDVHALNTVLHDVKRGKLDPARGRRRRLRRDSGRVAAPSLDVRRAPGTLL